MRKILLTALGAAAVSLAVVAAALGASTASSADSSQAAAALSCKSTMTIAMVTPLTGGAAILGQEQLSWAKYAVATLPKQYGLKIQLVQGDTPVEQGPAPAQALAQKYVSNKSVVAILGPSTSGGVAASSATYESAGLTQVSESATRTDLTQGPKAQREAGPNFFRVIPGDYIQGPSDANFMIKNLHVKKVVLFDFQEPYSLGLTAAADAILTKAGVQTVHLSAPNTTTDYSSYVSKVPSDADVVFFPTQKPGDAQTMATQLAEQGKKAKVFGGDGSNDPTAFKFPGSYVSNFAAPISLFPYDKPIIAGWQKANGGAAVGSFGPPTYLAVQVILKGIQAACAAGKGTIDRTKLSGFVKKVQIAKAIIGGNFAFSPSSNDPHNAKFYVFQIQQDGSYKLVG
jgi:branched-chain amino acid transport system substrate-binding protein